MFGALLRAAPQALFMALIAAVLSRILAPLVSFNLNGPATQSDLLINTLTTVSGNSLLIGILALLVTLVARAVVEAQLGAG
jgi:hypothetical protein